MPWDVKVGDRITLVGSSTHDQMRQRTMTVGGIFDIGMPDIEKRTVYMSLSEAQNLYDLNGAASEVMLILKQHRTRRAGHQGLKTQPAGLRDRFVADQFS